MKNDQPERKCWRCASMKPLTEFPIYDRISGVRRHECKTCNQKRMAGYYRASHAKRLERARARYAANPLAYWTPERRARANELAKARTTVLREQVLSVYGRKCACCGEAEPKFLTIDHVDNNGAEMRKEHRQGACMYRWLIKRGYPKGFQTLCMNCNFGKARNGGVCPHSSIEGSTTRAKARTAKRPEVPRTP